MTERDGFRVAVKASAVDANGAARALVAGRGETIRFDSRSEAESVATDLSARGATPVAVQRAAPQEPADVDAYLVPRPERRTHDPIEAGDGRLTFGTTAAQYGALGEALICSYGANPPALLAYVREDLAGAISGDSPEDLWIDVDRDPDPVVYGTNDGDPRLSWVPDCVARARDGPGGPVFETYPCEIKTGNASFQRDQATVMGYEAREQTVLKVRVHVADLPEEYTVRIGEVDPEEPPSGLRQGRSPDARLDDFA